MRRLTAAVLVMGGAASLFLELPADNEMDYQYKYEEVTVYPNDSLKIMSADEIEENYYTNGWTPNQ